MKQVKKMMVLLIAASIMAGCADAIPDLPGTEEEVVIEWTTLMGEFTILSPTTTDNGTVIDGNSTYSTVTIGTNNTWLEVNRINYTATHLSFEIVNNTVIFNNFSFSNDGYIIQDGLLFNSGYAPNYGQAELYFPTFPYDITVNYTVEYRMVNGR